MMITDDAFPVEPWRIRETELRLELLPQTESLFALSNGHIGLRGNLDEGEPYGLPGTYLNGFYEIRPLPYAEAGYGYPEDGQSIVDVTNGKIIRLLVEDEPFDVRYGELISHERILDLRAGTLSRTAEWRSPAGKQVRVHSMRLVSLAQRGLAAIEYDGAGGRRRARHRAVRAGGQRGSTRAVGRSASRSGAGESARTDAARGQRSRSAADPPDPRDSGLMVAAAMDHVVEAPGRVDVSGDAGEDWARTTVVCSLKAGERLRIRQVPGLRVVEPAVPARAARPGGRRHRQCALHRLAGPARHAARVPRRLLGQRRRRGRRRPRLPAGGALRAVSCPAGQRPCRAPRHRRKGADRDRLRRPRLLGHRGICAPGAHLHRTPGGGRRPAMAGVDAGHGARPRCRTRPEGCQLPVAHHPRRGVLGVLARGHRRISRQRRPSRWHSSGTAW